RGDSDLTVLEKVRAAQVVAPSSINPEVPKNLDAVVLKALAREPEERYANASDMLRDLEAVLYSYSPAPGSADLAIYLHRLQAEEQAAADIKSREAANAATPPPEKKRKSKGSPVPRRTGSAPKWVAPVAPAPSPTPPAQASARPETPPAGVFAAPPARRADAEAKSRAPLYTMIGIAVVALLAAGWWALRRPVPPSPAPVTRATPLPAIAPTAPAIPSPAPTAMVDQKVIEEEVQRQLAARKRELQKALEANMKPPKEAPAKKGEAAAAPQEAPAEAEPSPVPPSPRPQPTAAPAPTEPPPTIPPRPAPARNDSDVNRGELVGPGPGVVEPELTSPPKINYPAMARQQRVSGKVVVLVLVDETGAVAEARLQETIPSKSGVNEAVLDGLRRARFRPATKYGVPVKMWRTVIVDVKP
ncbi:MAG TPA: TonB family protein, partial [Thermoanaerobaculia bacterium]